NPALIAGRITNPDAKNYSYYDWAAAGSFEYKLETISIHGAAEEYSRLAGPVCVDALEAQAAITPNSIDAMDVSLAAVAAKQRGKVLSAKLASVATAVVPLTGSHPAATNNAGSQLAFTADGKLLLAVEARAIPGDSQVAARAQSSAAQSDTAA